MKSGESESEIVTDAVAAELRKYSKNWPAHAAIGQDSQPCVLLRLWSILDLIRSASHMALADEEE